MLIRSKNKMHCANSENGIISTDEKEQLVFTIIPELMLYLVNIQIQIKR